MRAGSNYIRRVDNPVGSFETTSSFFSNNWRFNGRDALFGLQSPANSTTLPDCVHMPRDLDGNVFAGIASGDSGGPAFESYQDRDSRLIGVALSGFVYSSRRNARPSWSWNLRNVRQSVAPQEWGECQALQVGSNYTTDQAKAAQIDAFTAQSSVNTRFQIDIVSKYLNLCNPRVRQNLSESARIGGVTLADMNDSCESVTSLLDPPPVGVKENSFVGLSDSGDSEGQGPASLSNDLTPTISISQGNLAEIAL